MVKIIEAANLPEEDKVYLKRDVFGWRTVNPIRNDDGTYNWINLLIGGWRNFIFLIIVVLLLLFAIYAYKHDMEVAKDYMKNPCNYCSYCSQVGKIPKTNFNFNLNNTEDNADGG